MTEIPTKSEEITAVWLTEVLRSSGVLGDTAISIILQIDIMSPR